jgi:hypothetical protein
MNRFRNRSTSSRSTEKSPKLAFDHEEKENESYNLIPGRCCPRLESLYSPLQLVKEMLIGLVETALDE